MSQSNQTPSNHSDPHTSHLTTALSALETQIAELRKQVSEAQRQSAQRRIGSAEILGALPKSGGMTAEELLKALPGLAKSSLWMHLRKLEKDAKVRFEETSRGRKDGRLHRVIYHADAMIT